MNHFLILVAIVIWLPLPLLYAEQAAEKLKEDLPSKLNGLTAPELKERVKARESLAKWAENHPEKAKELFLHHLRHSEDPEIRENCLVLLKQIATIDYGSFGEGYMGISMGNETMVQLPNSEEPLYGLSINSVTKGAPAEKAGLKPGDIIIAVNGHEWQKTQAILDSRNGIQAKIRAVGAGKVAQMSIWRQKQLLQIPVKLTRRPSNLDQVPTRFLPNGGLRIDEDDLARLVEEDKKSNAFFTEWLQLHLPEPDTK